MQTKVSDRGQVVVTKRLLKKVGIEAGDRLDITVDAEKRRIQIEKPAQLQSEQLAGSLARYGKRKPFPTRKQIQKALEKGLCVER